jgi:hypothetical protein
MFINLISTEYAQRNTYGVYCSPCADSVECCIPATENTKKHVNGGHKLIAGRYSGLHRV